MDLNLLSIPPRSESYRLSGPSTPRLPGIARDFVADVLPPTNHVHPDAIYAAKVCVSELVTNALQHTATPTITVEATIAAGRCVVHVHDNSLSPPTPGDYTTERERGRGLAMVQSYAEAWGATIYGGVSPTHKSVWFRIALSGRCAA